MAETYKGTLIKIDEKEYRIYDQQNGLFYLIEYKTTQFEPVVMSRHELEEGLNAGTIKIAEDQKIWLLDEDAFVSRLSQADAEMLNRKKAFWEEVKVNAGTGLLSLAGKKPKKWFEELYNKYEISKASAFRLVLKVTQNHPEICGLVDHRYKGAKAKSSENVGIRKSYESRYANDERVHILSPEDKANMDKFIEALKKGKYRTIKLAYLAMLDECYTVRTLVPKGVKTIGETRSFLPEGQRVSEPQFRRYLAQKEEDIAAIRMGKEAYRNDRRRLYGRPSTECPYAGYLVEVDALDVDLNIVSNYDHDAGVSRPTIYAMRDVLTGMILAVAVTLNKNSVRGITQLVMNLLSDHVALGKRFGIEITEELWPSFVVPSAWRTDHGSDFMAKALEEALNKAGVRKESAPPRTGSYKGKIESLFNVFYIKTKPYLEGNGLISKEYKGNDIEGACLCLDSLWTVAIEFVKWFNGHVYTNTERKVSSDILKKCPDAENSSAFLWKYWVEEKGEPRKADVATRTQILFNLMEVVPATIQRDGIHCKGLIYDEPLEDQGLRDAILASRSNANKRTTEGKLRNSIELRRDPGSVENLYYTKNGKVLKCKLNMARSNVYSFQIWST